MKVAVIGSGGREHTLIWKISQSPRVKKIYAIPGNGGTHRLAESVAIDVLDVTGINDFCKNNSIDMVMIGPEAPLAHGLADLLRRNGIPVVGAGRQASMLESSKVWAKDLMLKYGIPTAKF
ncbi:MAG: phosphoribosylamine--glycine ligase, partial [Oligoflexia bacterium]|nr:phosphoribosylamine--glycine ligase [Oligoflexia bacterium]